MTELMRLNDSIVRLDWNFVYDKLKGAPQGKLFGIPRGGSIVAGLSGRGTILVQEADVIVDDIVDSGRTKEKYAVHNKPFWPLVDKKRDGFEHKWVVFPWEHVDPIMDLEDSVIRQLEFIGENPKRDGLKETPYRVIRSLMELTKGYKENPAVILSKRFDVAYDEMVILNDISFWSLCEHHLLPFHGKVSIGYIPKGQVIGISKLARLVHCFSRRLQIQERMTQEIANAIMTHMKPQGVGVIAQAGHLCMEMRGIKNPAHMITSCLLGNMREGPVRQEFLSLVKGGSHGLA